MQEKQRIINELNKNIVNLESERIKAEKRGDIPNEMFWNNKRKTVEEIRDKIYAEIVDEELFQEAELMNMELERERNEIAVKRRQSEDNLNKNIIYLESERIKAKKRGDIPNEMLWNDKRKTLEEIRDKIANGIIDNEIFQEAERINMEIESERTARKTNKLIVNVVIILVICILVFCRCIENK